MNKISLTVTLCLLSLAVGLKLQTTHDQTVDKLKAADVWWKIMYPSLNQCVTSLTNTELRKLASSGQALTDKVKANVKASQTAICSRISQWSFEKHGSFDACYNNYAIKGGLPTWNPKKTL